MSFAWRTDEENILSLIRRTRYDNDHRCLIVTQARQGVSRDGEEGEEGQHLARSKSTRVMSSAQYGNQNWLECKQTCFKEIRSKRCLISSWVVPYARSSGQQWRVHRQHAGDSVLPPSETAERHPLPVTYIVHGHRCCASEWSRIVLYADDFTSRAQLSTVKHEDSLSHQNSCEHATRDANCIRTK